MRVLLVTIAVLASLTGCGNRHIDAAHKAIRAMLNEPKRAAFGEEMVYLKDDGQNFAVCGWVNDWQGHSYSGPKRYIVDGDYARIMTEENKFDFNGKYMEVCKQ